MDHLIPNGTKVILRRERLSGDRYLPDHTVGTIYGKAGEAGGAPFRFLVDFGRHGIWAIEPGALSLKAGHLCRHCCFTP